MLFRLLKWSLQFGRVFWMWRRVAWLAVSRHFVIIAESRYRLHGVTLCSKKSSSCYHKVWSVSFVCGSSNESFPCLLRGTEFGFLKCCHLLPSIYQIITLIVGAMNPYRNRTFYLHVSFCQYQSELLNGNLHVCLAVQRRAAPTQPVLAAGSCVCFGQAFNLFHDPCLTLSGREQRVSSSIIRLV